MLKPCVTMTIIVNSATSSIIIIGLLFLDTNGSGARGPRCYGVADKKIYTVPFLVSVGQDRELLFTLFIFYT